MKHQLVAVLPESLLSAPLDSETLESLNLLSVKAILFESHLDEHETRLMTLLKNVHPFDLLIPVIDPIDVTCYQWRLSAGDCSDKGADTLLIREQNHKTVRFPSALVNLIAWLDSPTSQWISAPFAILPVVRAIMNIHSLDPYLAAHYMRQLHPLLTSLSVESLTQILDAKQYRKYHPDENLPSEVSDYLKLEKKLHRQYLAH